MTVTPRFRLSLPTYNVPGWDDDVNSNFSVLDALLFQVIYVNNITGVWLNSTAYTVGQKAVDTTNSSLWACLINHTSASSGTFEDDRAAHPTYWEEVNAVTSDVLEAAADAADAATASGASAAAASSSASAAATSAAASSTSATASSTSATAAAASATAAAASVSVAGAPKNAVMNGEMLVSQRNTTFTCAAGVTTKVLDRWQAFHDGAGGTTTVSQFTTSQAALLDAGFRKDLRYNVTVAAAGQTVRQLSEYIESAVTFAGQTVTFSFYAYVASGSIDVDVLLSQNFGTGGSPSVAVDTAIGPFTITTTPTRFEATASLPSISSKTLGSNGNDALRPVFNLPVTGTYDLHITGIQLELGASATVFAHEPIADVIRQCERYYQTHQLVLGGRDTAGDGQAPFGNLRVQMFKTPAIAVTVNTATNIGVRTPSASSKTLATSFTVTATGVWLLNEAYALDAEVQ